MQVNGSRLTTAGWLRQADSPLAAFVAVGILLIAGPAEGSGPLSTFLQTDGGPMFIGNDASGNIVAVWNTRSNVPGRVADFVAAKFDPNATQTLYYAEIGGSDGLTFATAVAVDSQGNAYITGYTDSTRFPVTSGFSGPPPGGVLPFVVKLDSSGDVVFDTLYAGGISGQPSAIAVDSTGAVVLTGLAVSVYMATPGAVSVRNMLCTLGTGGVPVNQVFCQNFVTKLDPSGTKAVFIAVDVGGTSIALGPQGDIFVEGSTTVNTYPTTPGAFQTSFTSGSICGSEGFCEPAPEPYVTRLSADGSKLVYSTFLGGATTHSAVAVDDAGDAYVTGTGGIDFPSAALALGGRPGLFLAKLDPTGSKLLWAVQQGGNVLALDASGNPVVGGSFTSSTPPAFYAPGTTFPPPPSLGNTSAACLPNGQTVQSVPYVQSFSATDGSTISTRFLTASAATASGITIEPDGRAILAGPTGLPDVPLSPGVAFSQTAAQRTISGGYLAAFDLSHTPVGPRVDCVLDAATMMPVGPITPGQFLSLFGSNLGTSPAEVKVVLGGDAAALLYVSPGQINVVVPDIPDINPLAIDGDITVSVDSTPVLARTFAMPQDAVPSIFISPGAIPASCGPLSGGTPAYSAVALNADGTVNSCTNPAKPGSTVVLFVNGVSGRFTGVPAVRSGLVPLAIGLLTPYNGILMLPVQIPTLPATGPLGLELNVSFGDAPAGPIVTNGGAFQAPVVVWILQ